MSNNNIQICILLLLTLLCGCTSTQVEYGQFKVKRTSFLQSVNVEAKIDNDGMFTVKYGNDGGGEQTGKVIGTAVKTMVK